MHIFSRIDGIAAGTPEKDEVRRDAGPRTHLTGFALLSFHNQAKQNNNSIETPSSHRLI